MSYSNITGINPVSSIFPLSSSMKCVDVSSHYFFLVVIIDKAGHISLCNIHTM